ncbi:MAG: TetR/AcrR family transcriptional regulator [Firmicutes bacterium]|nr:TetR/AcrR family transcriptional regulator [Bacillota bacterium]
MRTIKEADERKNEILDAAESLFITKGYDSTTISDMLDAMGIARGTLYYHYKSKEEVLDGIIARLIAAGVAAAEAIADDCTLSATEKLLQIMLAQRPDHTRQEQLVVTLEHAGNAQMFQKTLTEGVLRLAPVLGRVIEQGTREGVFGTLYARESAEILLAAGHALFDNGEFRWTPKERAQKVSAFLLAAERILGAAEGSLLKLTRIF